MDSRSTDLERLADAVVARLTSLPRQGLSPERRSARELALDRLSYEVACRLAECLRPFATPGAEVQSSAGGDTTAPSSPEGDEAELAELAGRLLGELETIPRSPLPTHAIKL